MIARTPPTPPSRASLLRPRMGTLAVVLTLAGLATQPRLIGHLDLDRAAVVHGQIWRLWTGTLVAPGLRHLIPNLVLIALAGAGAEPMHPVRFRLLLLLGPAAISGLLLLLDPSLLSLASPTGLAAAVLAFLILARIAAGLDRAFWRTMLAVLVAALALEFLLARPTLSRMVPEGAHAAPLIHLVGAACGALALRLRRPTRPWRRTRPGQGSR